MSRETNGMAIAGYVYARVLLTALVKSGVLKAEELEKQITEHVASLNASSQIYPQFREHVTHAVDMISADTALILRG